MEPSIPHDSWFAWDVSLLSRKGNGIMKGLMSPESPPSPAVEIDNDLIAVDKGNKNGVVSEEKLLNAVVSHGAHKIAK
jgi:hypothetical protein